MLLQWITNTDRSRAHDLRDSMESHSGNVCIIGKPGSGDPSSVANMETMNIVGIYMEMQDDKSEPDHDCPVR